MYRVFHKANAFNRLNHDDPGILARQPLQVLAVVAVIVLGKSAAAFSNRSRIPLPAWHGSHRCRQLGANWGVLLYPRRAWNCTSFAFPRIPEPDRRRRAAVYHIELLPAPCGCAKSTNQPVRYRR
jgi:hypothetical protein